MSKIIKRKCFFDEKYNVILEGIPIEDRRFTVRIEGRVIEESDTQYKFKANHSFWSGYSVEILKYPNNSYARNNMNSPNVRPHYWLDKDRITFLR